MTSQEIKLQPITKEADIPKILLGTPFEELIKYHNLKKTINKCEKAQMVIVTCMDYRVNLHVPEQFAYVVRTAGANIKGLEFSIAFASSMAKLNHVAVIGHTNCGMVKLHTKEEKVVCGLVENVGFSKDEASKHFNECKNSFGIDHEASFVIDQCKALDKKYPKVTFIPFIYKVEDNLLYMIG